MCIRDSLRPRLADHQGALGPEDVELDLADVGMARVADATDSEAADELIFKLERDRREVLDIVVDAELVEVRRGAAVRVVDNFVTGNRANLLGQSNVELVEGDLADSEIARQAVVGVDYVLHQAAIPSVPRSVADPWVSHRANVDATLHLLLAAREAGVRRVIYAASSSAYGDAPTLPKVETMQPVPRSPYALQKLFGEEYSRLFTQLYGLETVSIRYFNVFGPRQDPNSQYSGVIARFITALLQGNSPVVYGDGEPVSYTHLTLPTKA